MQHGTDGTLVFVVSVQAVQRSVATQIKLLLLSLLLLITIMEMCKVPTSRLTEVNNLVFYAQSTSTVISRLKALNKHSTHTVHRDGEYNTDVKTYVVKLIVHSDAFKFV